MSFYRFARMEAQNRTELYLDGVMQPGRAWWDEEGEVICPQDFRDGMEMAGEGELVVKLNSPGGDLGTGIAIFEMIRQRKGKTRCEITMAMSAATLIPCACQESYISPAGSVMIHNPMMMVMGDEVELDRAQRALAVWKKGAIAAYQERIKKSDEEIAQMMRDETWLNAQAAVDLGLCDGILERAAAPVAMVYNRQVVMQAEQEGLARMIKARAEDAEMKERQALIEWAKQD